MTHTEKQIDAGAKSLREHDMQGRITRPWETLPKSAKQKWHLKAVAVLDAALQEIEP